MMHSPQPEPFDYSPPSTQLAGGFGRFVGAFLGGWFLGVIVTGISADILTRVIFGRRHDGGMYFIAAFAVVLEAPLLAALRAVLGKRVNAVFAFLFGLACGPLILGVMFAIS